MDAATASPGVSLPSCLERVRITGLPHSAYYIADFVTEEEEALLLQKIADAPKSRWKQLSHRRLQTWPGDLVHDKLLDSPLPVWLSEPVVSRLLSIPISDGDKTTNLFSTSPHKHPNHVLINEYPPGVGIMPHKVGLGRQLCRDGRSEKTHLGSRTEQPITR